MQPGTATNHCLLPLTNQRLRYLAYNALKGFFLPTVHAQQVTAPGESAETTVERLETGRPSLIISEKEVNDFLENESGKARVKEMFTRKGDGEYSEDVGVIVQMTRNCAFLVFLVTSVLGGNAAREKFVEKNKHKVYETKFQAFRAYNDTVLFGSLRFGLKWGFKSAFFTCLFMTTAQAISVYRNKTSVLEYAVAGSVTCALLRMNVGLKGMFAGAVIGSVFGLVGGGCLCALMYTTNSTQQQRRFWVIEQMLREKKEIEQLKSVPAVETLTTGTLEAVQAA